MMTFRHLSALALVGFVTSCGGPPVTSPPPAYEAPNGEVAPDGTAQPTGPATVEEAVAFARAADERLLELFTQESRAAWVNQTYIIDDTKALAAAAEEERMAYLADAQQKVTRFDGLDIPAPEGRMLQKLKLATALPAPPAPDKQKELARLSVELPSAYGAGKVCEGEKCRDLGDLSDVLAESRKEPELLEAWKAWRTVSPAYRDEYTRFVELGNEGAKAIGYSDVGAMWRSGYDMPPEAFAADIDRLWNQVRPLYEELHCHVRAKLHDQYGDKVPDSGAIPAHVLGNMWAQDWSNIYDLVAPHPNASKLDVTAGIKRQKWSATEMVKKGESFFTSLGLDPLPATFWERSQFEKPRDRDVVCHASAWDVTFDNDLRIKMCIKQTEEELITIHHELGHNYYFMAYHDLPVLLQDGANDGFHEGIGDTLALSVTPDYLKRIGVIGNAPKNEQAELNFLMKMALSKIAFLPFGRLVDEWRWKVFSGEIPASQYNAGWWQLREEIQGIKAPIPRSESDFDPGAKYHVPANTPYMRYFLAHIYQFQFHRALCDAAGHKGPLHTCSIYGSKEAGDRLWAMLKMGASKPWPDAMEAITGQRQADAQALIDYFEPLLVWLRAQNKGRTCGY